MDQLYYELVHNLVLEITRLGIDVKNLKMRVESVSSRLEFNERRARALESVVVYKSGDGDDVNTRAQAPARGHQPSPAAAPPRQQHQSQQSQPPMQSAPSPHTVQPSGANTGAGGTGQSPEGPGQRSRRRRRRRGRRGGGSAAAVMSGQAAPPQPGAPESRADLGGENDADIGDETEAIEEEAVATNDLEQFSGAVAHPSEPVIGPAETHTTTEHREPAEPLPPPSQGPVKTDPDTQ
jgi:hypothetical protein